jgi:hypothetical protein
MRRRVLAVLVSVLVLLAMMVFAGPAFAQASKNGCRGIETAINFAGAKPPPNPAQPTPPVKVPPFNLCQ